VRKASWKCGQLRAPRMLDNAAPLFLCWRGTSAPTPYKWGQLRSSRELVNELRPFGVGAAGPPLRRGNEDSCAARMS
jgi:hypothetical protein